MFVISDLNIIYKILIFSFVIKSFKANSPSIHSTSKPSNSIEPIKFGDFSAKNPTKNSETFHQSTPNHNPRDNHTIQTNNIQSNEVAYAMNSISFLEKLVALKNVVDVTYYSSIKPSSLNHFDNIDAVVRMRSSFPMEEDSKESSCEYTGRLWFMLNKGIRFREIVRVKSISTDGSSATIECHTQMMNGSGENDSWKNCSKVSCQVTSSEKNPDVVGLICQSELLVPIPLPGFAKRSIRQKIESTFISAATTFLQSLDRNIKVDNK